MARPELRTSCATFSSTVRASYCVRTLAIRLDYCQRSNRGIPGLTRNLIVFVDNDQRPRPAGRPGRLLGPGQGHCTEQLTMINIWFGLQRLAGRPNPGALVRAVKEQCGGPARGSDQRVRA